MSPRKKAPVPVSFEITSNELRELLQPVLPLAGKDQFIPILSAIHFETIDGHLIASATDRFRVGFCRTQIEGLKAGASMLVSTADLKRILTVFKSTRAINPLLRFTIGEHDETSTPTLTVEEMGGMFAAASFKFFTVQGDYPKLRVLIENSAEREPLEDSNILSLNPAYVADFQHAMRGSGEPMVMRSYGGKKPVIVTIGEHFIGAIMPMRTSESEAGDLLKHWSDVFTTPKPAARKKAS